MCEYLISNVFFSVALHVILICLKTFLKRMKMVLSFPFHLLAFAATKSGMWQAALATTTTTKNKKDTHTYIYEYKKAKF